MISIVICSRQKDIDQKLKDNIKASVGCDFELIVINNSNSTYSIFQAYNIGLKKSKGAYVCFLHDDISIHTLGWGTIINKIFNNNNDIGLLGVAGATAKSKMPSAWWRCPESHKRIKITQHSKHTSVEDYNSGFVDSLLEQVVVIDGVFMVLRKDARISFRNDIAGFHNYDLNISFEYVKHKYKIFVTNEISVEHFSAGSLNKDWIESTYRIHKLYADVLPLSIQNEGLGKHLEINNSKRFIKDCFKYNLNEIAFSTWTKLFLINPVSKYHIKFWTILIKKFSWM
ncbi:glycosyltransferase [Changchengzhania lutea]|uniref:glycosyltransferase n=1 Tax=Changchengzhania lutea TaxID=2049305 RepID=UPI00115ECC02|nr:glycosyltransferase [Changchengzhania lutea]